MVGVTLRPSAAHRWSKCTASVEACEGVVEPESSYAAEGTAVHALAEWCTDRFAGPEERLGDEINGIKITEEMVQTVNKYFDCIEEFLEGLEDFQIYYEVRVDLTHVIGAFGTIDCLIVGERAGVTWVYIVDLKNGKGVLVDAYENEQLMLYAFGALNREVYIDGLKQQILGDINKKHMVFSLHIIQPRRDHYPSYETNWRQLMEFMALRIVHAVQIIEDGQTSFVPGDKQCQFCPIKATCGALTEYSQNAIIGEFDILDEAGRRSLKSQFAPKDAAQLTPDEVGQIAEVAPTIRLWLNAVENRAKALLESGLDIRGVKLVDGQKRRHWTDTATVVGTLSRWGFSVDDYLPRDLLSPAQTEKLIGKEKMKELVGKGLVEKRSSGLVLAPIDDKRKAIPLALPDTVDPLPEESMDNVDEALFGENEISWLDMD